MTTEPTTDIAVAEFRELESSPVAGGMGMQVSSPQAFWNITPIPAEWARERKIKGEDGENTTEVVPYFVDDSVFGQSTPKHERKRHFKGYLYTTTDYARKQLNKAAGFGRWRWNEYNINVGREYTLLVGKPPAPKKYRDIKVEGNLLVPGYPAQYGVGSAPWAQDDSGDPRFVFSTAQKAASSLALKDAAKRGFGIGADINEDDATNAIVSGTQTTCVQMFNQLKQLGDTKFAAAKKVVMKLAPHALVGDGLVAESIDENIMDDLLQQLTAEVMKN